MKKQEIQDKVLCILYDIQKNNNEYQMMNSFNKLEKEIGAFAVDEIVRDLRSKGITNYNSRVGAKGDLLVVCGQPALSLDGIEYVENLRKPWFKKLNIKHKIWILCGFIITTISYFIVNILPNLDKIIENTKHYFFKIFN